MPGLLFLPAHTGGGSAWHRAPAFLSKGMFLGCGSSSRRAGGLAGVKCFSLLPWLEEASAALAVSWKQRLEPGEFYHLPSLVVFFRKYHR